MALEASSSSVVVPDAGHLDRHMLDLFFSPNGATAP